MMSIFQPTNVLILCSGNSARSIMAESLVNALGCGRWRAYSAGSRPTGQVNPFTLEILAEKGLPNEGLRSKTWNEFAQSDSPRMGLVVTVCESAAKEVSPVWPGRPAKLHMPFPDPVAAQGSRDERMEQFRIVFGMIENKMRRLIDLGPERINEV